MLNPLIYVYLFSLVMPVEQIETLSEKLGQMEQELSMVKDQLSTVQLERSQVHFKFAYISSIIGDRERAKKRERKSCMVLPLWLVFAGCRRTRRSQLPARQSC